MAVLLEGSIRRWIGLSTDEKPFLGYNDATGLTLAATDLPAGSSFMETDTGAIYRWTGVYWALAPESDEVPLLLSAILETLNEIKEILELGPG